MGAPIREELVLADSFSQTFRNFDAAANAAINVAETFQQTLNEFSEGFLDGLVSSLNDSRQKLEDMASTATGAADEQEKITKAVTDTDNEIKKAKDSEDKFTESIRTSENAAGSLMKTLSKIAGAVGVAKLTETFIETSDEMSQIATKLDMINDGSRTTAQLQEAIYESAQRSRGSYLDTANLIARIGMNAGDAFYDQVLAVNSNNKMVQFAENLNKAFKISGASAQEQASVILQMSQALGSGVLRGQEFNAVMSGATIVMQKVAEYLGVGIGNLKEMAADGQLTADILVRSMLYATDSINAQFNQLPKTFEGMMTTAKNKLINGMGDVFKNWSNTLGEARIQETIDDVTDALLDMAEVGGKALGAIADAIVDIHDNWDSIKPVITTVGTAVVAFKTLNVIQAAEVSAAWLGASGPFAGMALAIGGVTTLLTQTDAFDIFELKATGSLHSIRNAFEDMEDFMNDSITRTFTEKAPTAFDTFAAYAEETFSYVSDAIALSLRTVNTPLAGIAWAVNDFDSDVFEEWQSGRGGHLNLPAYYFEEDAVAGRKHASDVINFVPNDYVNPNWEANRVKEKADWYAQYYGEKPKDEWYGEHIDQNADWYAQYYGRDTGVHITEESWKAIQDMRDNGVKIKGEVKLSDEDLQIFRDISENRYIANVSLETLAPSVSVNVENNGQNLSEDDIATAVTKALETQISEHTAISHG